MIANGRVTHDEDSISTLTGLQTINHRYRNRLYPSSDFVEMMERGEGMSANTVTEEVTGEHGGREVASSLETPPAGQPKCYMHSGEDRSAAEIASAKSSSEDAVSSRKTNASREPGDGDTMKAEQNIGNGDSADKRYDRKDKRTDNGDIQPPNRRHADVQLLEDSGDTANQFLALARRSIERMPQPEGPSRPKKERSIPGAFAVSPASTPVPRSSGLVTTSIYQELGSDGQSSLFSLPQPTPTNPQHEVLLVANPVAAHDPNDIQQAKEHSEEICQRKTQHRKKETNKLIACIIFALVAFVNAVALLLLLHSKGNEWESNNPSNHPSHEPSALPLNQQDHILSLLPRQTIRALEHSDSPQAQAFAWLLDDGVFGAKYTDARIVQRYALATCFFSLEGHTWNRNDNWLNHSVHECEWFSQYTTQGGPTSTALDFSDPLAPCSYKPTEFDGNGNDDQVFQLEYTRLLLWENNLRGEIPVEISLLTSLLEVSLQVNHIEGTVPTEVSKLLQLDSLTLANNHLEGTIPTEIGLLSNLVYMPWLYNELTGTIPTELGLVSNMLWLFLDNNALTGSLPTEVGLMTHLEDPFFYSNLLTGTLPTELGLLSNAVFMSLDYNHFTGTMPSEFGQLSSVEHIVIKDNQLTGQLPSELGLLNSSVYYLHLGRNQITGPIPSELGQMSSMRNLQLAFNKITGQLPSELGLLRWSLQFLNLSENSISGVLPSDLAQLGNLTLLGLESNDLRGTIPEEFNALVTNGSLVAFNVAGNALLTGTIPHDICLSGQNTSCPESPLGGTMWSGF